MRLFTRTDTATTRETLRIFIREFKRDKKQAIIFSILIPLGYLCFIVLLPLVISFITQSLIVNSYDVRTPLILVGLMVVISLTASISHHLGYTILFRHEEHVTTRLTDYALGRLMKHSYGFFANAKTGSLTGDVVGFSRAYMTIADTLALQFCSIAVNFLASLIIIAIIAPLLLLPLGILTFLVIYLSIRSLQRRSDLRNERKRLMSRLTGSIADVIGNQTLVRVFAHEKKEVLEVVNQRKHIEYLTMKEVAIIQREANWRHTALFSFQILTILLCIWLSTRQLISIAALIFAITYLSRISGSLFNLSGIIRTIEQAFLDASPITKILSDPIDVINKKDASILQVSQGTIQLHDMGFRYKDSKAGAVFKDLSLTIPAGQRVGLAGQSGGGKTTLTHLLLRFADITSGTIAIDKQDIRDVTQESLRANISYVPQDPFLFHRSLRENISYGKPDASDKAILEAAKQAHAMEFIEKLPDGLDTIVGERGVKLSGGQRQRVAIARAILKNAPILILDEATSALDSESEHLIQAALENLMRNRTSIVIAHRLSTIAKLDRIIVLDNGKIVEDGTHKELLKRNGVYAGLWKHQSGGFLEE